MMWILLTLTILLSSCFIADTTKQEIGKTARVLVAGKVVKDTAKIVGDNITKRVEEKEKTNQKIVAKNTDKVKIAKEVLDSIKDEKQK